MDQQLDLVYQDNLKLSRLEYQAGHLFLRSQPRFLGLVLGNACNIYCPHCYQSKNNDNLLKPPELARELRREFSAFYPYLANLGVQGGEALAYSGFQDLLDDVALAASRPILEVTTNATLLDEAWAERIVRLPFRNLTVSIDGGTPATYARLRQGADLPQVLANIGRVQRWKEKLGSEYPHLTSFYVVMRSNFREIPRYLELMHEAGVPEVAFQTMEANHHNTSREPSLVQDEAIASEAEIRELHALLVGVMPSARRAFRQIRTSGFTSLFETCGLDHSFLHEAGEGLYPNSEDLVSVDSPPEHLCPNPWTTMFVAENGDVHLCFLAEPVGNLYDMPLAAIWNSPNAMAKRSRMISGRYTESGCNPLWCGWRDGKKMPEPAGGIAPLREEMKGLLARAAKLAPLVQIGGEPSPVGAVRRKIAEAERSARELGVMFQQLCETNQAIHERGQQYIDHLQRELAELRK